MHVIWKECQEDTIQRAANANLCEMVMQSESLLLGSEILNRLLKPSPWNRILNASVCPAVSMGDTPERHKVIGTVVYERSFGPIRKP